MKYFNSLKAIRAKCIDCCAGQAKEVRFCEVEDCPLFPFRFGKNPYTKRKGNKQNFKLHDNPPISNHSPGEIVKKSSDREPIFSKESILKGDSK